MPRGVQLINPHKGSALQYLYRLPRFIKPSNYRNIKGLCRGNDDFLNMSFPLGIFNTGIKYPTFFPKINPRKLYLGRLEKQVTEPLKDSSLLIRLRDRVQWIETPIEFYTDLDNSIAVSDRFITHTAYMFATIINNAFGLAPSWQYGQDSRKVFENRYGFLFEGGLSMETHHNYSREQQQTILSSVEAAHKLSVLLRQSSIPFGILTGASQASLDMRRGLGEVHSPDFFADTTATNPYLFNCRYNGYIVDTLQVEALAKTGFKKDRCKQVIQPLIAKYAKEHKLRFQPTVTETSDGFLVSLHLNPSSGEQALLNNIMSEISEALRSKSIPHSCNCGLDANAEDSFINFMPDFGEEGMDAKAFYMKQMNNRLRGSLVLGDKPLVEIYYGDSGNDINCILPVSLPAQTLRFGMISRQTGSGILSRVEDATELVERIGKMEFRVNRSNPSNYVVILDYPYAEAPLRFFEAMEYNPLKQALAIQELKTQAGFFKTLLSEFNSQNKTK